MARPNFFCDINTLNSILKMEFTKEEYKDIDLTMDLIELPFYFIFSSDAENWKLKAMKRGELYQHTETGISLGSLVVNKSSGEGQGEVRQEIGDNIGAFLEACKNISKLIQDNEMESFYTDFDPEETGIRLYEEDGKIRYKVVSGKERPDLMVSTLFGGTAMGRPYFEDFMDNTERESMSLEEKEEAAEAGDLNCMEELAMLYLNGDEETSADPEKAVYWFRKAAEAGSANAMFNLGLHYAKGHGTERDFRQAVYWMEQATDAGDDDAPKLVEEYQKLADSFEKAENGDAQAQADLARGLMKLGGSLEQAGNGNDYEESFKWAEKAADQGNTDGMWILALAYEHGRGVEKNIEKAVDYYKRGADLGHAASQHSLGCYYARGDFLEQDNQKAFELFQKAADQGYGLAMQALGRCYQFGTGCTGNMKTALEWYTKASEVLDDPELKARVMAFQSLEDVDPDWGEDYPGEDDDESDERAINILSQLEDLEKQAAEGPFDANEIMKNNLKAAGKAYDDDTLANMSVDEAYDALLGTFDEADDAESNEEDEVIDDAFQIEDGVLIRYNGK